MINNTLLGNNRTLNISTKQNHFYLQTILCFLFFCIFVGRAFNNLFCFAFLAISLSVVLFSSTSNCIVLLFFTLPFSSILKLEYSGISFFTIFFFAVALKMLLAKKRFDSNSLLAIILFACYCFVFSGLGQVSTIITMFLGLLVVSSLSKKDVHPESIIVAYSIGLILSSFLALFRNYLPLINSLFLDTTMKLADDAYEHRFSGLQGNPNYYTVDIILAIACLATIIIHKKQKPLHFILVGSLCVFGFMSISKSFLVSLIVLIFLWLVLIIKKNGFLRAFKFILGGAFIIGLIYFIARNSINLYLFRLLNDRGGSLNDISTGRIEIWKAYLEEIFTNAKILLFGNGLNALLDGRLGCHNTFIEVLYSLGIIGFSFFFLSLKFAFAGCKKRMKIVFLPVTVLLVRMVAINLLTYDNIWFYLIVLKAICISDIKYALNNNNRKVV